VLSGARILITGIATPDSIATATLARACELDARVVATAFPRDLEAARDVVAAVAPAVEVHPLDLTDPAMTADVAAAVGRRFGGLDGAVHAVAFAPRAALAGPFVETPADAAATAFTTSAWTLAALARLLTDAGAAGPASLVGLDFDADDRAWPVYDWMGVCKAALRSTARYLARDLGPAGVRVNLVAAGPLATRAATAIPGFDQLLRAWDTTSPLPWNPADAAPVADAVCFLLSPLARAITGEVLHVDGGYHAMAAPLPGGGAGAG